VSRIVVAAPHLMAQQPPVERVDARVAGPAAVGVADLSLSELLPGQAATFFCHDQRGDAATVGHAPGIAAS